MEEKMMINLRDDHISISKARLLDLMQGMACRICAFDDRELR